MEIIYSGGMITMADALKPAPTACQSAEPVDVWEDEEEEETAKDEEVEIVNKEELKKKKKEAS